MIPLLENVLSFLATWLKYWETKFSTETYKISKRATKELDAEDNPKKIGFIYEEETPEKKEDEVEDDS